ncbi:hypothetical protein PC112_g10969 [Phytophthora cactorum]|nr:hypothetical protein PC112_g10969 [Phytophthora cactorum]KAG3176605.1 hypothetical protein C6341_g8869 [Phytophthora cactorum]
MSGFFRAFNRIVGQKQRATMAYRPQANGTAERMKAWDEYVERLMIALNTAHDRPRALGVETASRVVGGTASRGIKRQYQQARGHVNAALRAAIEERADRQNEDTNTISRLETEFGYI